MNRAICTVSDASLAQQGKRLVHCPPSQLSCTHPAIRNPNARPDHWTTLGPASSALLTCPSASAGIRTFFIVDSGAIRHDQHQPRRPSIADR